MNNDLERVTKLAEECGAYEDINAGELVFDTPEQLLAFEQAVLAKGNKVLADRMLNTVSLEEHKRVTAKLAEAKEVIESLQAKLAMQAEYITVLAMDVPPEIWTNEYRQQYDKIAKPIQADVDAFMQGKKAELEKGVLEELAYKWLPHMKMKDHSGQTSLSQTMQNSGVDDCIRHTLSMAKENGGVR